VACREETVRRATAGGRSRAVRRVLLCVQAAADVFLRAQVGDVVVKVNGTAATRDNALPLLRESWLRQGAPTRLSLSRSGTAYGGRASSELLEVYIPPSDTRLGLPRPLPPVLTGHVSSFLARSPPTFLGFCCAAARAPRPAPPRSRADRRSSAKAHAPGQVSAGVFGGRRRSAQDRCAGERGKGQACDGPQGSSRGREGARRGAAERRQRRRVLAVQRGALFGASMREREREREREY
jgi:hypothetical protein